MISGLFNDIPKSIPGGSHMYTISCKASYISGYPPTSASFMGAILEEYLVTFFVCFFPFLSVLVLLLLSSHVERFCVSRMRDFLPSTVPIESQFGWKWPGRV